MWGWTRSGNRIARLSIGSSGVMASSRAASTSPLYVEAATINAEFKDGVLTVTLPKNEEARPKQIKVKVN
jgi:Hsp20/alpha crystallin family